MRIVQPIALAAREHLGREATSRSQIVARLVPQGGHRTRGSEARMGVGLPPVLTSPWSRPKPTSPSVSARRPASVSAARATPSPCDTSLFCRGP